MKGMEIFGCVVLAAAQSGFCIGAEKLDQRFLKANPGLRSYQLGYWLGLNFLFLALVPWVVVFGGVMDRWEIDAGTVLVVALLSGIAVALGVGMLLRDPLALILGTLLTLNPIIWWIGAVYIRNRWEELGGTSWPSFATLPSRAWYFLLARLAEVFRAFRGRVPHPPPPGVIPGRG